MAQVTSDGRTRARDTVTVELPANDESPEELRGEIARSLAKGVKSGDAWVVSVDAVEIIDVVNPAVDASQLVDQYGRTFWESATLEQLIAEQGVTPISNIDELVGDFWPEDEDPDEFVNWLREQRRAG